jgi:dsDNA-specific endonuclease/ATPase MutS2
MEGSVYSNLGLKMNRTFPEKRDEEVFTLKDFLEHKWTLNSNEELKRTFARDLKVVLQKENLFDLINGFFELESDLNHVLDQVEFEVSILNFDEFYKNLSPVLMRSLLENSQAPDNASLILQSIKESLRIALEEELYQLEDLI